MACDVNINGYLSQGIRGTVYQPVEDTYDRSAYHVGHLPYDDEDYAYFDSLGLESGRKRRWDLFNKLRVITWIFQDTTSSQGVSDELVFTHVTR